MSTNIGIGLTTNFKKMVNPIVLNSYKLIKNTSENPADIADFTEFLNSDSLSNKILQILQSLDTHDSTESLEVDSNPLDNIIRAEVIDLLNYRKISKIKIQAALDAITEGQEPNLLFTMDESIILLNQAKKLEYITDTIYTQLLDSPGMLWISYPESYTKLLQFQLNLPNNIPTIDELKVAGLVDFILQTVKENPDSLIDENLLKNFIKYYIDELLMTSEFIGYHNASLVLADPDYILNILGKPAFKNLAIRVMPYLSFITEEKIDTVMEYIPSQYRNIVNVFTKEQIRLMIDKELDIKNLILNTLTLSEVQKVFNELAQNFKTDFTEAFTNEKLLELIELTINNLYPEETTEGIYTQICSNYNITITDIDIIALEQKLQNYYN